MIWKLKVTQNDLVRRQAGKSQHTHRIEFICGKVFLCILKKLLGCSLFCCSPYCSYAFYYHVTHALLNVDGGRAYHKRIWCHVQCPRPKLEIHVAGQPTHNPLYFVGRSVLGRRNLSRRGSQRQLVPFDKFLIRQTFLEQLELVSSKPLAWPHFAQEQVSSWTTLDEKYFYSTKCTQVLKWVLLG